MTSALWLSILLVSCFTWKEAWNFKSEYNLCDTEPRHSPNGDYLPAIGNSATVYVDLSNASSSALYRCFMKFTTCHNCHFLVEPVYDFVFPHCHWTDIFIYYHNRCAPGCTYLHMFDPDYKNETSRSYSTMVSTQKFYTESSKLYIIVCSNHSGTRDVRLKIKLLVKEKKTRMLGSAYDSLQNRSLHSPFFPHFYAENDEIYIYEWHAVNHNDFIELTFDDWHMSPQSVVWFEHANIKGAIYGSSPRPVVYSDGDTLRMRFRTGASRSSVMRQYMGFKATYRFLNKEYSRHKTVTGCGKYEMRLDGGIIKFELTANARDSYDCVWVLKKQPEYDQIYVKLISYKGSLVYFHGQRDQLEIRDTLSSLGSLEVAVTPGNVDEIKTHSYEGTEGFYIRLRGRFSSREDFVLAFSSFKYGMCVSTQYQCLNAKCIPFGLKCDGYDHCGDNSDETSDVCGRSMYSGATSYTISIGVIIPMVVSMFLIVVICLLIIFIRRCRRLAQLNRNNANQQIGSISGNLEHGSRHRNRNRIRMNLTIQQDSPPDYDEVIRNTPIGYLNMAFMWTQPEDALVSPPSYEEATNSHTNDLHRLVSTDPAHNLSISSASSLESGHPHPRMLPPSSDSSTDGSQTSHTHAGSFSSDSTLNSVLGVESSQQLQESHRQKPVNDSFIEPVSSTALGNKVENRSSSTSADEPESGAIGSPFLSRGSVASMEESVAEERGNMSRIQHQSEGGGREGNSNSQTARENCANSPQSVIRLSLSSNSNTDCDRSGRSGSTENSPRSGIGENSPRSGISENSPCSDISENSPCSGIGENSPCSGISENSPRSGISENSPRSGISENSPHSGISENSPRSGISENSSRSGISENSPCSGISENSSRSGISENSPRSGISENSPSSGISENSSRSGISENSPRSGISENSPRSGISENSSRSGISENSPRSGISENYSGFGISENSPRSGISENSPRSGISENSSRSGNSENSPRSGISENSPRSGISKNSSRSGISENSPRSGINENSSRSGISENSPRSGISENSPRSGISENSSRSGISENSPLSGINMCCETIIPSIQEEITPNRTPAEEGRNVLTREMLFSFPNNIDHDTFV